MGRRHHPPEVRSACVDLVRAGWTARRVAALFGVDPTTALDWYREDTGEPVGYRMPGPAPIYPRHEWADLYRKGLTTGQIATKSGVKLMAVVHSLRKISPTGRVSDLRGNAND